MAGQVSIYIDRFKDLIVSDAKNQGTVRLFEEFARHQWSEKRKRELQEKNYF